MAKRPSAISPAVHAPRKLGLAVLAAQAARLGTADGPKLVYRPGLDRAAAAAEVLCPCDHPPDSCVTSVPLERVRFQLEGWLVAELWIGQCPHCRRVYWG